MKIHGRQAHPIITAPDRYTRDRDRKRRERAAEKQRLAREAHDRVVARILSFPPRPIK